MEARWTVYCDGIMAAPDWRCTSIVRGHEGEATRDLWRRAKIEHGWTRDVRTGQDFCKAKHLEGGDTSP